MIKNYRYKQFNKGLVYMLLLMAFSFDSQLVFPAGPLGAISAGHQQRLVTAQLEQSKRKTKPRKKTVSAQ